MKEAGKKKKWINTLKFFAAYLVAAWTFLQFVDWVLNRYNISPHWVDILLWFFIGISPSLLIYLYHQERLSKRILKLREKIIIPLNVILLVIALYFGFGNSDLGATTKNISYENEAGELETKTITKEEFRVGIPIYGFKQIVKDSTTDWMRYGIGKLLYEDLLQNKNLSPEFDYLTNTTTKIREASLFYDLYVDGSYQKTGDTYEITTHVRKANNGKSIKKQKFTGPDFMKLLDDISIFITSEAGFVENNNTINYIDLPINEFISNSLPALEAYANSDYTRAYDIDKSFALAYLEQAKRNTVYNRGKLETQDIIDKAFSLKNDLPLQKQLEVYIQRSLAYERYDEAEKQVKLQLEVDPTNEFYNSVLFAIYGETKNTESYIETAEKLFDDDPNAYSGLNLTEAAMVNGEEDRIIEALKAYEIIQPAISALKIEPLILKGDIKEARSVFEEYKLSNPDNSNRNRAYDSIFDYLKDSKPKIEDLRQFVGTYRSEQNELVLEYWIEKDRLVEFVKNQNMDIMVPAGPNAIGGGFIQNTTFYSKLVKDNNGKIIGLMSYQFNWNNTSQRLYYKIDNHILAANQAFEKQDLKLADSLYSIAIEQNPKHSYLKNISAHIKYISSNSTDSIQLQNKRYAGDYGPRKFWIENDKFYYKRKGESSELVKVELLPISQNRYMDLTRLGTLMEFVEDSSGKLASKAYSYVVGEELRFEWEFLNNDEAVNYFLKDD
ncbi:tetratricopeptide repeat protein [Winogradskyella sp. R77965]|uniref:tetratricopeptide repeat protein n=1 Tax=Winogradskyella sp. R77965 TaxID=3093872 RepID=UPI0037DCE436